MSLWQFLMGEYQKISWKILSLKSNFLKELLKTTNSCLINKMFMLHIILHRTSYTPEITQRPWQRNMYIRNLTYIQKSFIRLMDQHFYGSKET